MLSVSKHSKVEGTSMFEEENNLWALFWTLIAVVLVTLIVTIGVNTHNTNQMIANAKTCEQSVILNNSEGSQLALQIAACRGVGPIVIKQ